MGVPGPVATTVPACTACESTADAGRYNPTLLRSSPSSGAMSTRSPTTMRCLRSLLMCCSNPRVRRRFRPILSWSRPARAVSVMHNTGGAMPKTMRTTDTMRTSEPMQEQRRRVQRRAYTFYLDPSLVARARTEIEERDVVRSIEAALAAALDYQLWVREVAEGQR